MKVWTIILAAGAASRFGSPKALAPWQGGTLLSRAINAAPDPQYVIVVTGAHAKDITKVASITNIVHNPDWQNGMGTSIAAGLSFVAKREADMALIVPVDQPFVTTTYLNKLVMQSVAESRCVLTQDDDITGPPAAVPASFFARLQAMNGKGLKSVLNEYGLCHGAGMLQDIDTPKDLERLQKLAERTE